MEILDVLHEQVQTEANERRDQVEEHVQEANPQVTKLLHGTTDMLLAAFDQVEDHKCSRVLENGMILAFIADTVERAVESRLYLRILVMSLWKPTGVDDMMRGSVESHANAEAQIPVEKAPNYRGA